MYFSNSDKIDTIFRAWKLENVVSQLQDAMRFLTNLAEALSKKQNWVVVLEFWWLRPSKELFQLIINKYLFTYVILCR